MIQVRDLTSVVLIFRELVFTSAIFLADSSHPISSWTPPLAFYLAKKCFFWALNCEGDFRQKDFQPKQFLRSKPEVLGIFLHPSRTYLIKISKHSRSRRVNRVRNLWKFWKKKKTLIPLLSLALYIHNWCMWLAITETLWRTSSWFMLRTWDCGMFNSSAVIFLKHWAQKLESLQLISWTTMRLH